MRGTEKVKGTVDSARPVVERLARDDELHDHVKRAYESARAVYDELFADRSPKAMALKVAQDRNLQEELGRVLGELRAAGSRVRPEESHSKRNALLVTGIMIGILYNPATGPETRRWLKERVFGPDETFEYEGV